MILKPNIPGLDFHGSRSLFLWLAINSIFNIPVELRPITIALLLFVICSLQSTYASTLMRASLVLDGYGKIVIVLTTGLKDIRNKFMFHPSTLPWYLTESSIILKEYSDIDSPKGFGIPNGLFTLDDIVLSASTIESMQNLNK